MSDTASYPEAFGFRQVDRKYPPAWTHPDINIEVVCDSDAPTPAFRWVAIFRDDRSRIQNAGTGTHCVTALRELYDVLKCLADVDTRELMEALNNYSEGGTVGYLRRRLAVRARAVNKLGELLVAEGTRIPAPITQYEKVLRL